MVSVTRVPLDRDWQIAQKRRKLLDSAVAELDLDQRTVNGLERYGIIFVRQLVQLTCADLNRIKNFGEKSVQRIVDVLAEHGVALAKRPTDTLL